MVNIAFILHAKAASLCDETEEYITLKMVFRNNKKVIIWTERHCKPPLHLPHQDQPISLGIGKDAHSY